MCEGLEGGEGEGCRCAAQGSFGAAERAGAQHGTLPSVPPFPLSSLSKTHHVVERARPRDRPLLPQVQAQPKVGQLEGHVLAVKDHVLQLDVPVWGGVGGVEWEGAQTAQRHRQIWSPMEPHREVWDMERGGIVMRQA